ncbi:hypothetical protein ACNPNM_09395 [Klebsiella variicola]|uniref:hypothetical protein n=1 Tax=Klebsiella pneumoniae complex TaxID=3390273 RepID=UPI0026DFF0E8|nr:hypothetical protein [Klebsiella pneumoniae]HBR1895770.1 hypothetical protein [Klebsiella quasipneumoniae subsp. similipneumoniae]HBS3519386.1 hypothetical protein [Klebsiella variicola subsp. variicola]HBX8040707.1 hypothetical protein [Klebsiella pneumoniae]HBX8078878.1 hypothetical protein [Klebsiella pneumoniae]
MKEKILYPSIASHRIGELLSENISNETKAHISRWYAEMMIKEFLNDQFSNMDYNKKPLSELIGVLKGLVDCKIINSLNLIKDFGDKASHYNAGINVTAEQALKAVNETINLYVLIILDELKKRDLFYHFDRATLISVLLPNMRVRIYSELIDFSSKEINLELLWKWSLACLKDGNINKARRKLQLLKRNGIITEEVLNEYDANLKVINAAKENDELPIPVNREDFARNLQALLNSGEISPESLQINNRLISILLSMAKNIEPSSMKHYKGMLKY